MTALASIIVEQELNHSGRAVVEMVHLKKSFGRNHVLRDLNLVIHKGENLVILGKSGTGKSVLIKCIVGLVDPDGGRFVILGHDMADLKDKELLEMRRKIGFLFQSGALYDSMTVRENLEFPLRRRTVSMSNWKNLNTGYRTMREVGLAGAIDKCLPNFPVECAKDSVWRGL